MIVDVRKLSKQYGDFWALKDCNLQVPEGSVFGLLGPNGAGKTTLIRSLLGFLKPTAGRASIDGIDCVENSLQVRERVSYLPAETKLFRTMRGEDCLEFYSSIHPRGHLQRSRSLADRLGLDLRRRVALMSTGMRQKLAIACVLSCESRVVILDEPTANLDPTTRRVVLELTAESHHRGATILFCSHVMSEIEEICDHAAFLKGGAVVESVRLDQIPVIHRIRFRTTSSATFAEVESGSPSHEATAGPPPIGGRTLIRREGDVEEWEVRGDLSGHLKSLAAIDVEQLGIDSVSLESIYSQVHGV